MLNPPRALLTADDDLRSIATVMPTHTSQSGGLEQDMMDLGAAATSSPPNCARYDHQPTARWTPLLDASL
ncbi:MAG: hypothetical protein IPL78_06370, partial [Chloroflexi bacterium]|nr:hypothetical protein [Chloroflexota bacterium]